MTINRKEIRQRVHARIRKKVAGTTERPRLAIHFSNKNVYAQVIDDTKERISRAVTRARADPCSSPCAHP